MSDGTKPPEVSVSPESRPQLSEEMSNAIESLASVCYDVGFKHARGEVSEFVEADRERLDASLRARVASLELDAQKLREAGLRVAQEWYDGRLSATAVANLSSACDSDPDLFAKMSRAVAGTPENTK